MDPENERERTQMEEDEKREWSTRGARIRRKYRLFAVISSGRQLPSFSPEDGRRTAATCNRRGSCRSGHSAAFVRAGVPEKWISCEARLPPPPSPPSLLARSLPEGKCFSAGAERISILTWRERDTRSRVPL